MILIGMFPTHISPKQKKRKQDLKDVLSGAYKRSKGVMYVTHGSTLPP
jgi:hypothetical protein